MVSLFGRGFESHQLHTTSLSKGKTQIPLGYKRSLRPSLSNKTRNEQTPIHPWIGRFFVYDGKREHATYKANHLNGLIL